jgi:hypothetical protein
MKNKQKQLLTEIMNEDAKEGIFQFNNENARLGLNDFSPSEKLNIGGQQTAVEWLYKELTNYISYDYDKAYKQHEDVIDIVNQAKAMEKEQIIKAWWSGENDSSIDPKLMNDMAEQYYNETYKQ